MRFTSLLEESGLQVLTRSGDAEVTAVWADSRRCEGGSCFVAVRGASQDGHQFISSAVSSGASAVVCEDASRIPPDPSVPHAVVADSREALGRLAQAIRGWPSRKLTCIGVTGTNGKSTVTHLVHSILAQTGRSAAMLGTISYETGLRKVPAGMTTPDAAPLAGMMCEMLDAGVTHLVMETSSHALDQRRTAGVEFDVAVFTNLSGDHLDYHHTMDEYFAAKMRLFTSLSDDATVVLNCDDPHSQQIASCVSCAVRWYGLSPLADLRGRIDRIDSEGTVFDLLEGDRQVRLHAAMIGRHNVYNCLAAVSACEALGVDLAAAAEAVGHVPFVPGRLQRVPVAEGYQVFVDYAHTDDALHNVLGSLRPITRGRIIVVFGCGGDRDKTKRPRMARVAQEQADRIVVTSDNPRGEAPDGIIEDILAGFDPSGRARTDVQPARREAIRRAIELADEGDVVLIAGKGHETYQRIGERTIHFDDVEEAAEAIRRRENAE